LDVTVSTSVLLAAGVLVWTLLARGPAEKERGRPPELPTPDVPISIDEAHSKGSSAAKVALVEYSDFECPYCARFARTTLPVLERKYVDTGQILVAFKHYPLTTHQLAAKAAEASECAARQGKFWQMHDWLFADTRNLADRLSARGHQLGLAPAAFRQCIDKGQTSARIEDDMKDGRALRVTATPTFFLGPIGANRLVSVRRRIPGAASEQVFSEAIDDILRRVRS
jgi:protein-disulfide isomerase